MEPLRKREGTPNFTPYEQDILIDLVAKRKDVIENKRTDGVSIRSKEAMWLQVESEFNSSPGVTHRTAGKLKTCYENSKRKAKQDLADEKLKRKKTGGGSYVNETNITSNKILEILGPTARPLPNEYDCDAEYQGDTTLSAACSMNWEECEEVIVITPSKENIPEIKSSISAAETEPQISAVETETQASVAGTPKLWQNRRLPKLPKDSSLHTAIQASCSKRVEVLDEELKMKKEQLKIMKEDHLNAMQSHYLNIQLLEEKIKFWRRQNAESL